MDNTYRIHPRYPALTAAIMLPVAIDEAKLCDPCWLQLRDSVILLNPKGII